MLAGHDPSLSGLAQLLVKSFNFYLPKSSVLTVECRKRTWKDIVPECGRIKFFTAPINKKKTADIENRLTEALSGRLETLITDTLGKTDEAAAENSKKTVKKRSRQIAAEFMDRRENLILRTMDEISEYFFLREGQ
jgi:hypothetical protein